MKREYVVTDHEGNISWNDKTEKPETFKTFKAAKSRSTAMAKDNPGETMRIYELTAETVVPTKEPVTSRAHPFEHYQ